MKHFKSEAKIMLLIPVVLVAVGILGAMLAPLFFG
jgi:hypothetical protein